MPRNHFTRDARSINVPAWNDQGDFVRDKRPKHLHQMRTLWPSSLKIQSHGQPQLCRPAPKGVIPQ